MSECPDRFAIIYDKDLGHEVVKDFISKNIYNPDDNVDLKILVGKMNEMQDQIHSMRTKLMKTAIVIDGLNDNLTLYHELAHRCDLDGMDK
jgi:hypothetical protein